MKRTEYGRQAEAEAEAEAEAVTQRPVSSRDVRCKELHTDVSATNSGGAAAAEGKTVR